MTDIDKLLEETERLLAEATPGPWEARRDTVRDANGHGVADCMASGGDAIACAALIAHARTALPALVEEVKRLRKVNWEWFSREWVRGDKGEPGEVLPRVWVGEPVAVNHWWWDTGSCVWHISHSDGLDEIGIWEPFVPGDQPKPTIDPRTMRSIATCSEVDW